MNRRKVGILLILIGIGIPLVLFFFQERGNLVLRKPKQISVERKLTPQEIKIIEDLKKADKVLDRKISAEKYHRILREVMGKTTDEVSEELIRITELKEYIRLGLVALSKDKWIITTKKSLIIPYKYSIGIGIILVLTGIGVVIFSFLPKEAKKRREIN